MKIIKITCCDECPYCEYYNGWNEYSDVNVCQDRDKIIEDIWIIDKDCGLEEK